MIAPAGAFLSRRRTEAPRTGRTPASSRSALTTTSWSAGRAIAVAMSEMKIATRTATVMSRNSACISG